MTFFVVSVCFFLFFFFRVEHITTTGWAHDQRAKSVCCATFRSVPLEFISPPLHRVPRGRHLTPDDSPVYFFLSATTKPRYTISVGYLGPSTSDFYSGCLDRPTLSCLLLNSPGATVSYHRFGPTTLIASAAAMPVLHFSYRHQTAPASPPPTTSLPLLHRQFQPPRRHLRCENKTNSPPRPLLTSISTHVHWLLQRQPPRLHAQRGTRNFHRHDHRRHLLRPSLLNSYILTAGRIQCFYRRPRWPRHHRLALGTCNTSIPQHPLRFIGASGANSASTASSATNMPLLSRAGAS